MRVAACLGLLILCLGVTGCHLFGKRPGPGTTLPDRTPGAGSSSTRPDPDPPPSRETAGDGPVIGGLLAGRVMDSFNLRPPVAVILVEETGATGSSTPIEVATDQQGYFTIPGLKPGQSYRLVARVKDGEQVVAAGTSYATPPNPKLIIPVSASFVSPSTPPLPPEPTWPGAKSGAGDRSGQKKPGATLDRPWNPGSGSGGAPENTSPAPRGPAELGPPTPTPANPTPPATTTGAPDLSNIVDKGDKLQAGIPGSMPGPWGPSSTAPGSSRPAPAPSQSGAPFCLMISSGKLDNLVLNDLDGQRWDFRHTYHGRLVLLDFWGSWCPHCMQAIPDLVELQKRYGPLGLDVVGIDYEAEGTVEERARIVKGVRDRMRINYRLLLGGDMDSCPVKKQLGVLRFPTLLLLDERGNVLWQSEGLDSNRRRQLEAEIKWNLKATR